MGALEAKKGKGRMGNKGGVTKVKISPLMMEEGQAQLHKKDKSQDMSIQSQAKSV